MADNRPDPAQLWLFPWKNPLTDQIGRSFFLSIPASPGTYRMRSVDKRVIYVGQSKNLRQRINQYRYIHPKNSSPRLCRLVSLIDLIDWVLTGDETASKLLENDWIRQYRPRFNRLKTHPESHLYINIAVGHDRITTAWGWHENDFPQFTPSATSQVFGAFPHTPVKEALAALRRCFWLRENPRGKLFDLPVMLTRSPTLPSITQSTGKTPLAKAADERRLMRKIEEFFEGKSDSLIGRLTGRAGEKLGRLDDRHLAALLDRDRETLKRFYVFATQRNFTLRKRHGLRTRQTTGKAQLDDLLVYPRPRTPPGFISPV